jgi:hypothetical protein
LRFSDNLSEGASGGGRHPLTKGKQERNMNTEMNKEMRNSTRELTIDELEIVNGGAGRIPVRNVFDDPFFNPGVKIVEKY